MINLNKEAEEFSRNFTTGKSEETPQEYITDMLVSFTNNSKNIQAKIIQAQIDVLEKTRTFFDVSKLNVYEQKHHIRFTSIIIDQMKQLQQQLKQLQDETNN